LLLSLPEKANGVCCTRSHLGANCHAEFLFLVVLALSFSIEAISQTTPPSCSGTAIGNVVAQSAAVARIGVATPYSLTAIIKTEMKLSDGNTISGFTISRQAQDSRGRTRVDSPLTCAMDNDHQPKWQGSIVIIDPVAKTNTAWLEILNAPTKIATIMHVPAVRVSNPPTAQAEYRAAQHMSQANDHAGPQTKHDSQQIEDLGRRNINGLEASGMRITRTSPAGMAGNLLSLAYVEEKWVSDQYGIILLDIKDDPIWGKSTYEVTNFTRAEPDASLFQPPLTTKSMNEP
jgi:hypothetical protein